tara:strand:+ start:116 stop:535 length:420 start_codon:yes stop_codon:yes gene_type:complete
MKLNRRGREEPDVIITPLIDVVFLLLIFFMVSTTFQRDSALTIELPEASSDTSTQSENPIDISVDVQGRYYVNGFQLINSQLKTVKQAMIDAADGRDSPQILINADANAPYQSVITLMDAASQLGFMNLSFPIRLVEEE